jgi:hypothetical protein
MGGAYSVGHQHPALQLLQLCVFTIARDCLLASGMQRWGQDTGDVLVTVRRGVLDELLGLLPLLVSLSPLGDSTKAACVSGGLLRVHAIAMPPLLKHAG